MEKQLICSNIIVKIDVDGVLRNFVDSVYDVLLAAKFIPDDMSGIKDISIQTDVIHIQMLLKN